MIAVSNVFPDSYVSLRIASIPFDRSRAATSPDTLDPRFHFPSQMSSASPLLSMMRIGAGVTGYFYGFTRLFYLEGVEAKKTERKRAERKAAKAAHASSAHSAGLDHPTVVASSHAAHH